MAALTILAAQKAANLLTSGGALQQAIEDLASETNLAIPMIGAGQVTLSSASPEIGDKDLQLTYPRVCVYSAGLKNTRQEKFRSLSGVVSVAAEIWASDNLADQAGQWVHYYVEAVSGVMRANVGDWGDGLFFSGIYDVEFQAPKPGGFGYVKSAKLTFSLNFSRN